MLIGLFCSNLCLSLREVVLSDSFVRCFAMEIMLAMDVAP